MSNRYKTILFTSNLSTASRIAFKEAAILATTFEAKIILLHVMEGPYSYYESYVSSLFGQDEWQRILKNNREEAKHALVGKVTPKQMVKTVLSELCKDKDTEDENFSLPNYEILVENGDVVETILDKAIDYNCDLIVMGSSKGLLSGVSVGKNIKSVLKKSKVPVLVVPPNS